MKKFIATMTYQGTCIGGSKFELVEASNKAVAQKRAEKLAASELKIWQSYSVSVEEITPAKLEALETELARLDEEIDRFTSIRRSINRCVRVTKF